MAFVNFVIGVIFGSAAGALAYRLPKGISWMRGRSKCDACNHELGWWDLIPIISYLGLRGKCRYCHSPIGIRNLIIEIVCGLGFVAVPGVLLKAVFWVTVVIFVMDWETKLVAEILVVIWGILVLFMGGGDVRGLVAGVSIIGGLWAVTRGRGMGFGDVEMALVMGWWLGWPKIMVALWLAFVVGGVIGGVRVIRGIGGMKSEIAFGPFLIIGTWIAHGMGDDILRIIGYGF